MSAYRNARDVLPEELLEAVQRHVEGTSLYVPVRGARRGWGERTGARDATDRRNVEIRRRYRAGAGIEELAAAYHLSSETVQKLVKGLRQKRF